MSASAETGAGLDLCWLAEAARWLSWIFGRGGRLVVVVVVVDVVVVLELGAAVDDDDDEWSSFST